MPYMYAFLSFFCFFFLLKLIEHHLITHGPHTTTWHVFSFHLKLFLCSKTIPQKTQSMTKGTKKKKKIYIQEKNIGEKRSYGILPGEQKLAHPTLYLSTVGFSFSIGNLLEYGICSDNFDNRSTTEGALPTTPYQFIGTFRTSAHVATSAQITIVSINQGVHKGSFCIWH